MVSSNRPASNSSQLTSLSFKSVFQLFALQVIEEEKQRICASRRKPRTECWSVYSFCLFFVGFRYRRSLLNSVSVLGFAARAKSHIAYLPRILYFVWNLRKKTQKNVFSTQTTSNSMYPSLRLSSPSQMKTPWWQTWSYNEWQRVYYWIKKFRTQTLQG